MNYSKNKTHNCVLSITERELQETIFKLNY